MSQLLRQLSPSLQLWLCQLLLSALKVPSALDRRDFVVVQ